MSNWRDFLDELFADKSKPGKVMICFVNRYLEGLDGIKYKIRHDGVERIGTTTTDNFGIELTPRSLKPIQTYVWSRKAGAFKKLDDVVPELGKKKLVRKVLKTFKVPAKTEPLPSSSAKPRPTQPAVAPAAAPSPTTPQGVQPTQQKNESDQPQVSVDRPVPGQITVTQLRKIFPLVNGRPTDGHLQAVADEINANSQKFKLDTPFRLAHFFGQIKQESPDLTGSAECLNYSVNALLGKFGYYKKHRDEAQIDGRHDLQGGRVRGRGLTQQQQEIIANKIYMPPDGNRDLGNREAGDGWKYRGRGVHQTTGVLNYRSFSEGHEQVWGESVDFVRSPELLSVMPYSIRSAVFYWLQNEVWRRADGGVDDGSIDAVTKIINAGELKAFKTGGSRDDPSNPVIRRRRFVKAAYAAFS